MNATLKIKISVPCSSFSKTGSKHSPTHKRIRMSHLIEYLPPAYKSTTEGDVLPGVCLLTDGGGGVTQCLSYNTSHHWFHVLSRGLPQSNILSQASGRRMGYPFSWNRMVYPQSRTGETSPSPARKGYALDRLRRGRHVSCGFPQDFVSFHFAHNRFRLWCVRKIL